MKKIILTVILFLFCASAHAQYGWEKISYYYSTGPVSPEFQYNYNIQISENGNGKLEYTKSGKTEQYDFSVGRKGLQTLNGAILKSKVLSVSSDELKSDENLIGGPVYSTTITLPFPEGEKEKEKNPVVIIPNHIAEEYTSGVYNLYHTLEMLVPLSIWNHAKGAEW